MEIPRRQFLHLAASAAALPGGLAAQAQAYPTRPIRLVVPLPPGGAVDALARPWADKIRPLLGTVFVDNVGGAGGSLGAAQVAHARPDGYTLLLGGSLTYTNEALLKTHPLYNPDKDLEPVMCLAVGPLAIAVHPSIQAATLKELVAYAKANPGKLSYGHAGVGSPNHLVGELFKSLAAIPDVTPVPYRGAGPLIPDLISGHVPIGIIGVSGQSLGFHRAGNIRILAVTSPRPLSAAPEIASGLRPRRRRQEPACSQKLSVDFVAARTRKVSGRKAFRKEGTI